MLSKSDELGVWTTVAIRIAEKGLGIDLEYLIRYHPQPKPLEGLPLTILSFSPDLKSFLKGKREEMTSNREQTILSKMLVLGAGNTSRKVAVVPSIPKPKEAPVSAFSSTRNTTPFWGNCPSVTEGWLSLSMRADRGRAKTA